MMFPFIRFRSGIRRPTARVAAGLVGGLVAAGIAGALVLNGGTGEAEAPQMHRAVYDLSIDRVKLGSEVEGLEGRMVVESRGGPACDGYVSEQRVVSRLSDGAGAVTVSDVRLSTFETLGGAEFRFDRQEYMDGKLAMRESGHAYRKDGKVFLKEPEKDERILPKGVLFPAAFNTELMAAAKDGKSVFSGPLFDGTQSTVANVTAFIGKPGDAPGDAKKVRISNARDGAVLGKGPVWPVQMSYFDADRQVGEGTPSFELTFSMFPNGVVSALTLDYDDIVVKGALAQIEYFKPGTC